MSNILLSIAIANMVLVPVSAELEFPNGIYAELCGSGRTVYIPLPSDKGDTESPAHHTKACHAICSDREIKVIRKST